MIDFRAFTPDALQSFTPYFQQNCRRGCEYSFVNLYLWGRQKAAIVQGHLVFFSQFDRKAVYLFPLGQREKKPVLEALREDAAQRGIACCLVGLQQEDLALLERLYPGLLQCHFDRNSFDYVYDIRDLAELKGKKYQKKRNHLNRFRLENPDFRLEPITEENLPEVTQLLDRWYALRQAENPHSDYQMEKTALNKALSHYRELSLEGVLLKTHGEATAMAIGSRLCSDTFDIHFEKALNQADGTYAAINQGFAQYLLEKYPQVQFLNREDDMGIEGLRKAKLSYHPHHMVEKSWACIQEG